MFELLVASCIPTDSDALPFCVSLPMASREEIQNSTPAGPGATSSYTAGGMDRPSSPVTEDPSAELEKELASTHLVNRYHA